MAKDVKVAIVGDAKSFIGSLTAANGAADGFGSKMIGIGGAVALGFGAAAVGVGAALFEIGSNFDDAYDNIRVKTGKTGEALDGMKDSFRDVVSEVPTDFGKASDAIAEVSQKLDLTGDPLEGVSEQFLELSRITGTDLKGNLDAGTDALNNWGVTAEDQPGKLDEIFRASQQSGASFADLSTQIGEAGPVLRDIGFSFDETAALLATLAKAGLDTSDVMPALSKSLAVAAKEGKPAGEVFDDVFNKIANAPDETSAAAAAMDVFGAKAGPKLAGLIREGKLSYEDMMSAIQGGSDTILGAGEDTQDFAEKWELFKNRTLIALEPIATRVFTFIGDAMGNLSALADELSAAWGEGGWGGVMSTLGDKISAAWPDIQAAIGDLAAKVGAWLQEEVPVIANQLAMWGAAFIEWVGPQIPPLLEKLGELLGALGSWLLDTGLPLIASKLVEWGVAFLQWVGPAIPPMLVELGKLWLEFERWLLTEALPKIVSTLLQWAAAFGAWVATDAIPSLLAALPGLLSTLVDWLTDTALPAIVNGVARFAEAVLHWIGEAAMQAPGKVAELIGVVKGEIGKLPGEIIAALADMARRLYDKALEWGQAIVDGIRDKVTDIPGIIAGALGGGGIGPAIGGSVDSSGKYSPPHVSKPIPQFAMGGMVRGVGPKLAIVHGGEQVLTPEQQGRGGAFVQIIVQGNVTRESMPMLRGVGERAARELARAGST